MTDTALLRALRHNVWANLELLAFCDRLTAEQLAWTAPGTYGSIHATLQHTVGAENGYLFALTGQLPPGGRLTPDLVPLSQLIERERTNGERIESVVGAGFDPERVITRARGDTATAGIIVAQFVHHGSDHRAHVGTILGAHGIEPPEIDVWAYGSEIGEALPPPGA
jgi:uncharacterized damage-inducible protein DinB